MDIDIVFEDQDVVVIAKPPGVVVNRASSAPGETLQEWFAQRYGGGEVYGDRSTWEALVPPDFDAEYGSPEELFAQREGMVHRLDKDTSGVVVFAKNPGALVHLLAQFKQRQVRKRYTCLVHGKFRVPEGIISAPVERASYDRQQFTVGATGRPAETHYAVEQFFIGLKPELVSDIAAAGELSSREFLKRSTLYQGFSLVQCWPKTGRTHQIRVHLKHWRHPIVGDATYVGKKRAKLDRLWVPRQFLHASELELMHPRTGELLNFVAPLSDDLQKSLHYLY